jgi:hypothetical protein
LGVLSFWVKEIKMKKLLGVAIIFLLLPVVSYGQLVTIQIEAKVNYLNDYYNLLQGNVALGSTITGTYTYDTSTPDTNYEVNIGSYVYNSVPYGMKFSVNNLTFVTNPQNINFGIGITNDSQDFYGIVSRNNVLLYDWIKVTNISLQFWDYSGMALSSTALLTTAPIISDWDNAILYINGENMQCDKTFGIMANIISAVLVPEPVSLFLFGIGLLALHKQK